MKTVLKYMGLFLKYCSIVSFKLLGFDLTLAVSSKGSGAVQKQREKRELERIHAMSNFNPINIFEQMILDSPKKLQGTLSKTIGITLIAAHKN